MAAADISSSPVYTAGARFLRDNREFSLRFQDSSLSERTRDSRKLLPPSKWRACISNNCLDTVIV